MKKSLLLALVFVVAACSPQGQLAVPAQNVAERFEVSGGMRPSYQWTVPGAPAVLSLGAEGPHEMLWTVSEKSMSRVRRSRLQSLQTVPRFFAQGPAGVQEVRFSPSGKTILAHEVSGDGGRFQTVLFRQDVSTGAWRSRILNLGKPAETKARKLDDGSRVPGLVTAAVAPKILRLDENLVIYEVADETQSFKW